MNEIIFLKPNINLDKISVSCETGDLRAVLESSPGIVYGHQIFAQS